MAKTRIRILFTQKIQKRKKFTQTECIPVVARGLEEPELGSTCLMDTEVHLGARKMLWN